MVKLLYSHNMSHGAGHIQDMINRVKQNAALKNSRRQKFKGGNDYSKIKTTKTEYDFPKLSGYKLSELKKKIRAEAKKDQIKRKILVALGILFLLSLLLIFNFY